MRELYRSPADADRIQSWCRERLDAWPVRHDTEHLDTSLGRTHLTWAGTAREAVCLYLPGTNFNAATSTTLLTSLASRWRVACADLPGQPGLSAAGRPVDEVADYARWLAEVLAHVRQQHPQLPLVVAGHSRGAAAALLANPADVDGLVLVSPAGLAKVRLTPALLWRSIPWLLQPTPARSRATRRPDGGRQWRGTRSARRVADVGRNLYPDHRCPRPAPSRTAGSMAGPWSA